MNDINVKETTFIVVGLNATGRSLTLMLGALGAKKLILVDDKVVSGSEQGYMNIDIGLKKTEAVKDTLAEICRTEVETHNSVDSELMERLTSIINDNMVVITCEPVGVKTKGHICRNLQTVCKAAIFVGFYEDGEPLVAVHDRSSMQEAPYQNLDTSPTAKESLETSPLAAAQVLNFIMARERDLNLS